MRSLRARLTLSYTALLAAALAVVAVLGEQLVFEALAHPYLDATETSVRIAEAIVASRPHDPPREVEDEIAIVAQHEGVVIRLPPRRAPMTGTITMPPDDLRGMVGFGFGPSPFFVLKPHIVRVGNEGIFIAPDVHRLRPAITLTLEVFAVSLLAALAIAWLIARWITDQAIRPLVAVTAQLRRFAGGDFTPRPVRTSDREELGSLIAAYNGAAAKVAEAFEERRDVEEHMRRFVADAGHELRTPLTVIDGYVQILRKGAPDDLALRDRSLQMLQMQTARMRTLIERLMVLARLERPDLAPADPVDATAIAADAIASVTAARGGRVRLVTDGQATIVGSAGDLHEAVGNLVDNALKYGAGTPVTVALDASDEKVTVRVRDGGPGIPPHERRRIFERFYRGDARGAVDGSGLGLAIVVRAAARCGGSVVLESGEPGRTTFALHFRAARAHVRDAAPLEV